MNPEIYKILQNAVQGDSNEFHPNRKVTSSDIAKLVDSLASSQSDPELISVKRQLSQHLSYSSLLSSLFTAEGAESVRNFTLAHANMQKSGDVQTWNDLLAKLTVRQLIEICEAVKIKKVDMDWYRRAMWGYVLREISRDTFFNLPETMSPALQKHLLKKFCAHINPNSTIDHVSQQTLNDIAATTLKGVPTNRFYLNLERKEACRLIQDINTLRLSSLLQKVMNCGELNKQSSLLAVEAAAATSLKTETKEEAQKGLERHAEAVKIQQYINILESWQKKGQIPKLDCIGTDCKFTLYQLQAKADAIKQYAETCEARLVKDRNDMLKKKKARGDALNLSQKWQLFTS